MSRWPYLLEIDVDRAINCEFLSMYGDLCPHYALVRVNLV